MVDTIVFYPEIVIPAMIVISSLVPEEEQFTILFFPPKRCEEKNGTYFTSILPECIIAVMGISMLVVIGWIIHKVR